MVGAPDQISRYLIDGNKYYVFSVIDISDELEGETVEQFFNSFQILKKAAPFDFTSSKTALICEHLRSEEPAVFNKAKAAITFYDFEEKDVDDLVKEIDRNHPLDTGSVELKNTLLNMASDYLNESHHEVLKNYFLKYKSYGDLPNELMYEISQLDHPAAYDTYLNLLLENTPSETIYTDFYPLKDSLEMAAKHFDQLMKFSKREQPFFGKFYSLVNLLLSSEDESLKKVVYPHTKALLSSADKELEEYKTRVDTSGNEYVAPGLAYRFLNIMENLEEKELTSSYTQKVLDMEVEDWLTVSALTLRLSRGWEVPDTLVDHYLAEDWARIEMMKALDAANQTNRIPEQYLERAFFSKTAIADCIQSEEYAADEYLLVGTIPDGADVYYDVYNVVYKDEPEYEYIAIVGPFTNGSDAINYDYRCNVDWSGSKETTWEEKAKQLLERLKR